LPVPAPCGISVKREPDGWIIGIAPGFGAGRGHIAVSGNVIVGQILETVIDVDPSVEESLRDDLEMGLISAALEFADAAQRTLNNANMADLERRLKDLQFHVMALKNYRRR
jgi:hypothetical protein